MPISDWSVFSPIILQLEQEGLVTRTFRRLDSARQQAVLEAILTEATERGPADLSIKSIAARAGVAVGSLYQYFPDRDGLLDFAVQLCVRYMVVMFEQSLPYLVAMPLGEALSAYLLGGMEWGSIETNLVRFFGRAAYEGDARLKETLVYPVAQVMRETTRAILVAAQQRGEIRPDVDLEAAARLVNAAVVALSDSQLFPYLNTYFQVTDESLPFERVTAALLMLVTRGLGPAGAGS